MPGTGGAKGAGNMRGQGCREHEGPEGGGSSGGAWLFVVEGAARRRHESFFFARCAEKKSRWVVSRCGLFALDNCVVLVAVCSDSRCLMTQLCSELGGLGVLLHCAVARSAAFRCTVGYRMLTLLGLL